jgi:hypothetical protein
MPVEVTEMNGQGVPFVDRTFIEDVSDFGCRFSTRVPIKQGDTIALKILGRYGNKLPDEEPRLYEIMWVAAKGHVSTVGARLRHSEKLANAKFPPETGGEKPDSR